MKVVSRWDNQKDDTPFKEERYLSRDYIPEKLLTRESEQDQIIDLIIKHFSSSVGENIFIWGPPGSGKTHTIKRIQYEAKELIKSRNLNCDMIYQSCNGKTLYETIIKLNQKFRKYPDSGISLGRAMEDLIQFFTKKTITLVLDEFDKIVETERTVGDPLNDILSFFTRIGEYTSGDIDDIIQVQLILITNDHTIKKDITAPNQSTFSPEKIMFERYNADEIRKILKDRIEKSFKDDVVTSEAISLLSAKVNTGTGDIRDGLRILDICGNRFCKDRNDKVTADTVYKAIDYKQKCDLKKTIMGLSDHEFLTLFSVALDGKALSNNVYNRYSNLAKKVGYEEPESYRHIRERLIPRLDSLGLVKVGRKGRSGKRGGSRHYFYIGDDESFEVMNEIVNNLEHPIIQHKQDLFQQTLRAFS